MWFEELVGFAETAADEVRSKLSVDHEFLQSMANGRTLRCGRLETPSLTELRQRSNARALGAPITLREVASESGALHRDQDNAGAFFQVASQFNLLEMASPTATPERGVGIYEHDPTQGPACAIACGAGTIYRNWFAPVATQMGTQIGQSADTQIDCLADLGDALNNNGGRLWVMQNGYCLATAPGLTEVAERLAEPGERDRLRGLIRIGLQLDTEVTTSETGHCVSQAYCSAMPVAYSPHPSDLWEPFARLILESAYEATLLAAAENAARTGNRNVYLTLVGGGVFGNRTEWILNAITTAMARQPGLALDVAVVSYGSSSPSIVDRVESYASKQ